MKLNFELCKELYENGFELVEPLLITPGMIIKHERWIDEHGKSYPEPILSELIEACGDRFYSLWRRENGEWRSASEKEGNDFIVGSTPEEAVAKLWLSINKK